MPRSIDNGRGRGSSMAMEMARAREMYESEHQRRERLSEERRNTPMRFYVPVGEERRIIILDEYMTQKGFEHRFMTPGSKRPSFINCVRENEVCNACIHLNSEGGYVLYLSVLDLTPYKAKNGDMVEFSRKLMAIGERDQGIWWRHFERICGKDFSKPLRGAEFILYRSKEKTSIFGDDIQFVGMANMDEEDFTTVYEVPGKGKVEEDRGEVLDYSVAIPHYSNDELAEYFGMTAPRAGGRGEADEFRRTRGGGERTRPDRSSQRDQLDDDGDGDKEPIRRRESSRGDQEAGTQRARRPSRDSYASDGADGDGYDDDLPFDGDPSDDGLGHATRGGSRSRPSAESEEPRRGRPSREEAPGQRRGGSRGADDYDDDYADMDDPEEKHSRGRQRPRRGEDSADTPRRRR